MARYRENLTAQKDRRQRSVRKGKHPQGAIKAKAQRPVRRSARLNPECSEHNQRQHSLSANKTLYREDRLTAPQSIHRKRTCEVEYPIDDTAPLRKRLRTSPADFAVETQTGEGASVCGSEPPLDPIDYWRRQQTWPKKYFEPGNTMSHLLARRKWTPSLRRKRSESGSLAASSTPSDQKSREEKSAPYKDPRYRTLLETKGSFMDKSELDITDTSKSLCRDLLEKEQTVPKDSLFRDDIFDKACRNLQDKNEARVIYNITQLIVPSAETLATFGARSLEVLVESVNEGWNSSWPLVGPRPQPDYAVGFKRSAFTEEQLTKVMPIFGDVMDTSLYMATYYMYLPFLTCEVKCGAAALDIADRQNAHSMTLAVRAIVQLFRYAKREKELHRQILAFSISHDHRTVRIYGHYPVIDGAQTTFYRHPIHEFSFTALDGKEKWTAYKFTKNVYDIWMPTHLDKIRSVINELPSDFDFEVPLLPEESGLSQGLESHHLSRSFTEPESLPGERGSQSGIVDVRDITPNTSFTGQAASKKPRRNALNSKR